MLSSRISTSSLDDSQNNGNSRKRTAVTLILLLVCSLAFALYKSDSAYTSDEVWSIQAASLDYASLMETLKADVHPPLYYQLLYGWLHLFGPGERAVRSLSGLFYVLSVFGVYAICPALHGNKIALLCASIYLYSPWAIHSAQVARIYAL